MRFGSGSKKKWGKCVLFRIGMNVAEHCRAPAGKERIEIQF